MLKTLNLNVILTQPPVDAPPHTIASVTLHDEAHGLNHTGGLLQNPFSREEKEQLHWYLEEYWKWPYEQFHERGKKIEALLPVLGKRLYQAIFGNNSAQGILQAWRLQPADQYQISIVSDIPHVLNLPWELLHYEQGFLVLRTRHPVAIVRRLSLQELPALPTPFEPPLRILLVTARPDDAGFVDPRGIGRELLAAVSGQLEEGTIALEFLRPPTLPALRQRLSNSKLSPVHVLHFDGHGAFGTELISQDGLQFKSEGSDQGMLAFENEVGKEQLVRAGELAQVLLDSGIRLAVFNACQSAVSNLDDAFSSIATRLIQGGIDVVIAMSASVLVTTAARYVGAFYRALATGTAIPIANERARQALHDDPHRHLTNRDGNTEGEPVRLYDWWVPHYYQQRPLLPELISATHTATSSPKRTHKQPNAFLALSESTPAAPRHGFSGRTHELLQIERDLLQQKLVVIHGFGGMGKTALAREAAEWFTSTGLYQRVCFISFEQGGESTMLLGLLGSFLGIYDGNYNPSKSTAMLDKIQHIAKQQKILVIADNVESILPSGEAALESEERVQLWQILLTLQKLGMGVVLTMRVLPIGEKELAAGKDVAHLQLEGLFPDDAYQLACRVLENVGIDRARVPYSDLCALLAELDYHPLSIQLVLPTLREHSLATIRADFVRLLPTFVDDIATGYNRSLLASLDYSLRRLTQTQRTLLSRLALFESGASEDDLLAITQIPQKIWDTPSNRKLCSL